MRNVFVVFCALSTSSAYGDMVGVGALRDATLYESSTGALANGAGQHLFAGRTGGGSLRRGLLQFDLSGISPGATITSATLTLHYSQGQSLAADVSLHRALAGWTSGASDPEGNEGGGAAAVAGDATWLHSSFDSALWIAPGGDFTQAASAATLVGADFGFHHWSGAGLVADLQAWLDGEATNFGWFLRGVEALDGTSKRFDSSEHPIAEFRPTLVIEYVVPTPATAALLLFAALSPRRRR